MNDNSVGADASDSPLPLQASRVSDGTITHMADVLRAQKGDAAAFDRLVRAHQDGAVGYAAALLGGSDFDLARDAAQEAFVDAWRHLGALRKPEAFRGWLGRIVRKHCDRFTRGTRTRRAVSLDAAAEVAAPPETTDPARAAELRDLSGRLRAALSYLPESERAVVLLFYVGSRSHVEVGAFLGIAPKTVKSRLHSARRHLRERIKGVMEEDLDEVVEKSLETMGNERRPSRDGAFAEQVAALIRAIDRGDAATVRSMVSARPELANAKTSRPFWDGQVRALHAAVEAGNSEAARALIEGGADVNAVTDEHQWRPLHLALSCRQPEMISLLLHAGARVDVFAAAGLGDTARLQELLAADPTSARATAGPDGATPLHFAADEQVVDILLDAGADINAKDACHSATPAAWVASSGGNTALASYLLARGAEADLWLACALDLVETLDVLLTDDPERASRPSGDRNVLRAGFTAYPLHFAARYGSVEAAKRLIGAGADVAARSGDGSLPIHDAAYKGHVAVIGLLLDHGSPINEPEDLYHATPLGVAEYAKRTQAAAYLRTRGGQ